MQILSEEWTADEIGIVYVLIKVLPINELDDNTPKREQNPNEGMENFGSITYLICALICR